MPDAAMHNPRLYGRLMREDTRLQQVHTIGRKGLKLSSSCPSRHCRWPQADPQYLMQVMTNLLSNAVHYTPAGGRITLITGLATWDSP